MRGGGRETGGGERGTGGGGEVSGWRLQGGGTDRGRVPTCIPTVALPFVRAPCWWPPGCSRFLGQYKDVQLVALALQLLELLDSKHDTL